MKYRADIDGLRAVAVMSVVAFHAGFDKLAPGGFVGVDVFFVISGYLITNILLREIETGAYSLIGFYERRVRRIVPALAAMLIACWFAAGVLLLPTEMTEFASSVLSTVLFSSNLFFWQTTNYFDGGSTRPLLHTWSLAVEEQYYILFPLVLAGLARIRRIERQHFFAIFSGLAAISLACCIYATIHDPTAAFFLPQYRAWELLVGALVAIAPVRIGSAPLRNVLTLAGAAAILLPVLTYSETMLFPGYAAAAPVLGAALIIAAGTGGSSLVSWALSLRPVVMVGLWSYSIYLWHWPLIVFSRLDPALDNTQGRLFGLGIIAVSILLGYLSWRFIERPFRSSEGIGRPAVFKSAFATAGMMAIICFAAIGTKGMAFRFSPEAGRVASYLKYDDAAYFRRGTCFVTTAEERSRFSSSTCMRESPERPDYLLVGDSHGAHLWYGLAQAIDGNVMQATASGCRPLVPADEDNLPATCEDLFRGVYQDYLTQHRVDRLIIAGRWKAGDLPGLRRTLEWTKAHSVPTVVIGPVQEYDQALPRLLALDRQFDGRSLADRHRIKSKRALEGSLRSAALAAGAEYISVQDELCNPANCMTSVGGAPLQFDYGHLTKEGSVEVGRRIAAKMQGVDYAMATVAKPAGGPAHN